MGNELSAQVIELPPLVLVDEHSSEIVLLEARRRMAYVVVKDEHLSWDEKRVTEFLNRYFA